jgi:hypothetical protein
MAPARSVEELLSIQAIIDLKSRYCRLIDSKDWVGYAELYTEDAMLQWGPAADHVVHGRANIRRFLSETLAHGFTTHHVHNPEIQVHGDGTATGTWALFEYLRVTPDPPRPGERPQLNRHGYGRYDETYQLEGDSWRIASLKLTFGRRDWLEPDTPAATT